MASDCEHALAVLARVAATLAAFETTPGRLPASGGSGFWDGPNSQEAAVVADGLAARCSEARRRLTGLAVMARRDAALLR